MEWLGAGLFLLSAAGQLYLVRRALRCSWFVLPLLTAAALGLGLYLGALAGLLRPAARLLWAAGMIGAAWLAVELFKGRARMPGLSLCGFCLAAGSLVFGAVSLRLHLIHYDNFSHWVLMVKYLLVTDHLPDAGAELVVFPDYPPGTALLIWYLCQFLGHSQGVMLLAQNGLLLCCFAALFQAVEEPRRFLLYAVLGMGCSMLSYLNISIRINSLLVDFLLPLLTLASVAVTHRSRRCPRECILPNLLILGLTTIVKNTGPVFAAIALVWDFCLLWTQRQKHRPARARGPLCWAVLTGLGSFAPFALWRWHLATALAGYRGKFEAGSGTPVTPEQRAPLARAFVAAALDPASRATQVFLLGNLLAVGLILGARVVLHRRWRLLPALLAADGVTLGYLAGILWLYLWRMPAEEALRLAGMERYACSIVTFFAGVLLLEVVDAMGHSFAVPIGPEGSYRAFASPDTKRLYQYGVLAAVLLGFIFLYSELNGLLDIEASYPATLPGRVAALTGDIWPEDGKVNPGRYLVAASDRDGQVSSGEVTFVARYFLCAPQVTVTETLDAPTLARARGRYDGILVLDRAAVQLPQGSPLQTPGLYPADIWQ